MLGWREAGHVEQLTAPLITIPSHFLAETDTARSTDAQCGAQLWIHVWVFLHVRNDITTLAGWLM